MGPYEEFGWGRRIRTPATWSRATRPTTRRSPTSAQTRYNLTTKPRHAQPPQRKAVLRLRLGRKRGTRAGGILISLPVRGLRPLRAARRATTNVPKPEIVTRRPRRSDSTMPPTKAFMARSAEVFEPPALFAMIATISAFVITSPAQPLLLACRDRVNQDVRSGRDAPHGVEEVRGLKRLLEDHHARVLQERKRLAVGGVACDEDEALAQRRIVLGGGAIKRLAVAVRHPDVGHDQVVALLAHPLEPFAAAGGDVHAPAGLAQDRHDQIEHARLVFDHERDAAFARDDHGRARRHRAVGGRCLRHRQLEPEDRTARPALDDQVATVLLDDAVRDRQPEAGAAADGLGAEEGLEDVG